MMFVRLVACFMSYNALSMLQASAMCMTMLLKLINLRFWIWDSAIVVWDSGL